MRQPEEELAALREAGLYRTLRPLEAAPPPFLRFEGREYLNFSSNDYLGLSHHPNVVAAAHSALDSHGAGSSASRLVCGSLDLHHQLERTIASLKGVSAALSFSTGYATAVGILTALLKKGDTVILDKLCHASLVDGARLSGATLRVFPHNHLGKLRRLLASTSGPRTSQSRVMVVTESVFSMDGDRAPLSEIVALVEEFDALLLIDEAHAIGVLGPSGQGLIEAEGLRTRVPLQLGTLGKAVGAAGGYVAGEQAWIDLLVNKARALIYSTAPSPAQVGAARAGLELIASPDGAALREALWRNLDHFTTLTGIPCRSAIVPLITGDNESALRAAEGLREAGYFVPAIRYPTVPRNQARLRITISAAHRPEHIEGLTRELRSLQLLD